MIVLSAAPRSGKTTFCALNSYATLYDMIKSQGFFGSTDYNVAHQQDEPSFRSNGKIPFGYMTSSCFLDVVSKPVPGQLCTFLLVNPKNVPSKIHISHVLEEKLLFKTDLDLNKIAKSIEWPEHPDDLSVKFYIKYGCLEPFYIKHSDFYSMLYQGHVLTTNLLYGYDISHLIFTGIYTGNSDRPVIYSSLIGIGFNNRNDNTVCFAMNHKYFEDSINFSGLPYINVAEAGPSIANRYITAIHGQISDGGIYRRVFALTNRITFDFSSAIRVLGTVSAFVFRTFITTRIARVRLHPFLIIADLAAAAVLSPVFNDLTEYVGAKISYDSTDDQNVQNKFFSPSEGNYPYSASSFILNTNRAYFDSIIDVLYTSGGNTLSGGIPAEVIRKFINTQLNESIGIYSALGGDNNKDPFHSLATDAHMAGNYSFVQKGKWPNELYFTTRNTNNRYKWYALVDKKYIYGNYIKIIRDTEHSVEDKMALEANFNRFDSISASNTPIYQETNYDFVDTNDKIKQNPIKKGVVRIERLF